MKCCADISSRADDAFHKLMVPEGVGHQIHANPVDDKLSQGCDESTFPGVRVQDLLGCFLQACSVVLDIGHDFVFGYGVV